MTCVIGMVEIPSPQLERLLPCTHTTMTGKTAASWLPIYMYNNHDRELVATASLSHFSLPGVP